MRTKADLSPHTLAIYGQLAAILAGESHKGERFVAAGRTRAYPVGAVDAEDVRYEFVATRIRHDAADDTLARSMSRHPASRARHLDTRSSQPRLRRRADGCGAGPAPPADPSPARQSARRRRLAARDLKRR